MQISKKRKKKSSDNGMQEEALNLIRNKESVKLYPIAWEKEEACNIYEWKRRSKAGPFPSCV